MCVFREYLLLTKFILQNDLPLEFSRFSLTRYHLVSNFDVQVGHFPSATQGEELCVFRYIERARCRNDRVNSCYDWVKHGKIQSCSLLWSSQRAEMNIEKGGVKRGPPSVCWPSTRARGGVYPVMCAPAWIVTFFHHWHMQLGCNTPSLLPFQFLFV